MDGTVSRNNRRGGARSRKHNVLITGATRSIARQLVQRLYFDNRIGHIIAVGNEHLPYYFKEYKTNKFTYIRLDIRKYRALSNLFNSNEYVDRKIDTIVHLAIVGDPKEYENTIHELHIGGTKNILENCFQDPNIKKFIFLSSSVVYKFSGTTDALVDEDHDLNFDPDAHPIVRDYIGAELLCRTKLQNTKCQVIVLRPAGIIGRNVHSAINALLESVIHLKPMGYDPMINPIHVEDVVNALDLIVFKSKSGIFNIAGPDIAPLSTFMRLSNKPCIPVPGPLMPMSNFLLRRLGFTRYDYGVNSDRLKYNLILDTEKACTELGFTPKYHIKF